MVVSFVMVPLKTPPHIHLFFSEYTTIFPMIIHWIFLGRWVHLSISPLPYLSYFVKTVSHRCGTRPWAILSRGKDPCATVDEIAALGLRHVGYAVPIELFEPFVEGVAQVDLWRW